MAERACSTVSVSSSGAAWVADVQDCSPVATSYRPPVVCIAGLLEPAPGLCELFLPVLAAKLDRRVIFLSRRTKPWLRSVTEAAYDLCAALRALSLERCVLLSDGHGANVAMRTAVCDPTRVLGLVLCSGACRPEAMPEAPPLGPGAAAGFVGRTLLLWGSDDESSPLSEQLDLLRLLKPRAELKTIDGGTHALLWQPDKVDEVAAAAAAFARSLDGRWRTSLDWPAVAPDRLHAFSAAAAASLEEVRRGEGETTAALLRRLRDRAASCGPPPPPTDGSSRTVGQVRAVLGRLSQAQLRGLAGTVEHPVDDGAAKEQLVESLLQSAPLVNAMRAPSHAEVRRAADIARRAEAKFVEQLGGSLRAGRGALEEAAMPSAEAVAARLRGEREHLSSRRARRLVETESLEDLRADWREWLDGYEKRSAACQKLRVEASRLGGDGARVGAPGAAGGGDAAARPPALLDPASGEPLVQDDV